MPVPYRAFLLLAATSVLCYADITFGATNPQFPYAGSTNVGATGDPLKFGIQDFTLTGPFSGPGTWTLTIDTNYGANLADPSVYSGTGAIPAFCEGTVISGSCHGVSLFLSDFLIQQGSKFYGVVLSNHGTYSPGYSDGYVAGNAYSAPGFLDPFQKFFPQGPVILDKGGTLVGTGTGESAVANPGCVGDISKGPAHDCALYKITNTFTVGPGSTFFDPVQPFTIYVSSADCDNEFMLYESNGVPEPSGLIWLVPALILLGGYLRRHSLAQVK